MVSLKDSVLSDLLRSRCRQIAGCENSTHTFMYGRQTKSYSLQDEFYGYDRQESTIFGDKDALIFNMLQ